MREKDKYIGVFDSGLGGVTVVKNIIESLPNENIIYLGDSKHMPYGDKTKEQIIQYTYDDIAFLNNYELKAVVIACNTCDAVAHSTVKDKINLPMFGVINSAAKTAAKTTKNNKVGVIATTAAINSKEYEKRIKKYNFNCEVYSMACPFLVPLIEQGKFNIDNQEIRIMIEEYLSPLLENNIDTLVLGCTHYDLLFDIITDMYPDLKLVSSSRCVVEEIKKNVALAEARHIDRQFFCTSDKKKFQEIAGRIIPDIEVKEI